MLWDVEPHKPEMVGRHSAALPTDATERIGSHSRPVLEVRDLSTEIWDRRATRSIIINAINFDVRQGEIVALVGESGSGKSITCLSILRLLGHSTRVRGSIRLDGRDISRLTSTEMEDVRGAEIGMIFQDPVGSQNPVRTIGSQLVETCLRHGAANRRVAQASAISLLEAVGVPAAGTRMGAYPHELSGGLCQRVMIAQALAGSPRLLIADEPTTALDVTIQAQILSLIQKACRERDLAVLLVTHDLGVVAQYADRVLVMYAGAIVEAGPIGEVFRRPAHPYTQRLLAAVPRLDQPSDTLVGIAGRMPGPGERPNGCTFAARCDRCSDICLSSVPPTVPVASEHRVTCYLPLHDQMPAAVNA